jgi:long-chain acyl-CoA synthetase
MKASSGAPMASVSSLLAGQTILVTGATGFLAKAWLSKVLRDLEEIQRIVVLLRPRRRSGGQIMSARERLVGEVLASSAFRTLRKERGDSFDRDVARRVVAVEGDLTREGLGLSAADQEVVASVTSVVNSAATVTFDERLDVALSINTLGIRRLLLACRQQGNVPLVHVSTAYTCGRRRGLILEEPPSLTRAAIDDLEARPDSLDLDREIEALERTCRDVEAESLSPAIARSIEASSARTGEPIDAARRRWLKDRLVDAGMARARGRGWNDTYTYTKSLGERVLLRERGNVPACIVRPAIIESALKEPEPGWIDGLRMADPLFAAYGKGALSELPADPASVVDFIPVDHVVNAMIAAQARLIASPPQGGELPVVHVATSSSNPLTFERLVDLTRTYFRDNPLRGRDGRPVVPARIHLTDDASFRRKSRARLWVLDLAARLLERVPGKVAARWRSAAARLRAQSERLDYYIRIYGPYTSFPARFDTTRLDELRLALAPEDMALLDFDARAFDWETYIRDIHLPGIVRNVLREPAATPMAHSVAREEGAEEERTIPQLIERAARLHGSRVALRSVSGRSFTHAQAWERALHVASVLKAKGVVPGDCVVLFSENSPEWPMAWFGISAAGATVVPVDAQAQGRRVGEIARVTGARAAIVSARCAAALASPLPCETLRLEDLEGSLAMSEAAARDLPVAVPAEQAAAILFTSGTTLEPKGVVLPHRAFVANAVAIADLLRPTPEDRLVSVLPLHHAFEFTGGLLAPLSAGASVTYLETLSSQAIVDALRETRATVLLGVPRLYELLLEGISKQMADLPGGAGAALGALRGTSRALGAMGVNAARTLLSPLHARFGGCLRAFVSGGAALDPKVHQELEALGFTVIEGYGLTECAPVLTVNPPDATRAGSVGKPLPGVEIRIHRPGSDGVGEILARGPNLMTGYYRDQAATERVLREGWFHTGDLGIFDADGYLRITGRLKDLIVTGSGKNVYPDEVESELGVLPGVKEACVVGVRARAGAGEEVHLVVVPKDPADAAGHAAIREAVARACEPLQPHQRVQRIHFWDEDLPKTALMKVKRGAVKARLDGETPAAHVERAPVESDPLAREVLGTLARLARVHASTLHAGQNLAYDLGVDSLMLVELVASVEAATGGRASEEASKDLVTVGDLVDLARRLAQERGAARVQATASTTDEAAARPGLLARTAAPLVRTTWPLLYGRYLRMEVRGREHLPARGAYIIAANHQSHLDAPAILTALGEASRRLHVVAARDYFFDTPWKGGFFAELLNAIPFDRGADFQGSLEACRVALRAGDPLLIFPEGTRSPDGRLQEFKPGVGVLALGLSVPVVPTRIDGTHEALPKGATLPRPGRVRVTFGEPFLAAELVPDEASALAYERWRAVADVIRQRIVELGAQPVGRIA